MLVHIPQWFIVTVTGPTAIWFMATLLNIVFWARTPAQWETFCENNPKLSWVIRISRATGVHPRKILGLIFSATVSLRKKGFQMEPAVDDPSTIPSALPPVVVLPTPSSTATPKVEEEVSEIKKA